MEYNKIYYRHGTMYSGKTTDLIRAFSTYQQDKKIVMALKPSADTRDEDITSRLINVHIPCHKIGPKESLYDKVVSIIERSGFVPDAIFIDEVQFLQPEQVQELHKLSKLSQILCYGLKRSYTGDLFPAIVKLESLAEDIAEIKTTCSFCNSKATHNLLVRNGEPVYSGDLVNIEGENTQDMYYKVCRCHFYDPDKSKI